ncbi:hypothetical protein TWF506_010775 [Arthrobotrys conoides]|uniref:F-box domain-containing protein n=1 Tax=Arthrobotrys conoides TaxID=74498 RepID=A0AAN8RL81_9PEZI
MEWIREFQVITVLPDVVPIQYDFVPDYAIGISIQGVWNEYDTVAFPRSVTGSIYRMLGDPDVHIPSAGVAFRVPVHTACLAITARLLAWRRPYTDSAYARAFGIPTNIQQLYDAIKEAKRRQSSVLVNIEWPHLYYGARSQWSTPWMAELGQEWLAANPIYVPDYIEYTATILSLLRPPFRPFPQPAATRLSNGVAAPHTNGIASGLTSPPSHHSTFETLPGPVYDEIRDNLDIHSIQCLRSCSSKVRNSIALTPRFWKDRLLSGEAVPWLWDIDTAQVELADVDNDWGGLVRALRMPGRYLDQRLPIGLRNRIRIFKIVEEIRLRCEERRPGW